MLNSYRNFWLGTFSFKERSRRSDFWSALLIQSIIAVALGLLLLLFRELGNSVLPSLATGISWLFIEIFIFYGLISLLPLLALTVRRLRDIAIPWPLIFLNLLPVVGSIVLLILCTLDSSAGAAELSLFSGKLAPARINETGKIGLPQALKHFFTGYFDFRGRTTRTSFWWMQLLFWGGLILIDAFLWLSQNLEQFIFQENSVATVTMEGTLFIYLLILLLPEAALLARRLRDAGLTPVSITVLSGLTLFSLSFSRILNQLSIMSYGVHTFPLTSYLFFLLNLVFLFSLICLALLPTDDLLADHFSLFFRKKV